MHSNAWMVPGTALLAAMLPLLPLVVAATEQAAGWREEFDRMPAGWEVRTKPGTPAATFTIAPLGEKPHGALRMEAKKASASLVAKLEGVDLKKTPVLRWRWRVLTLPEGADGRDARKDDQAIGIYVSTGNFLRQKSLAYRWETDTPVGAEGDAKYAGGVVRVHWYALRNRDNHKDQAFFEETRNVAEDFQKVYGEIPDKIGLSISCNSQGTGTLAVAELDWVEFVPAEAVVPAPARAP